ncbi:hypothetical protein [Nocardioides limicola]|uniref:hypothetical protein n=1 Tax=Nocardioides limicola TaxID=2803368 RepID=UPI00193BE5F6|nr:hypothetical protein [Nocardioides sp. DJM-14]
MFSLEDGRRCAIPAETLTVDWVRGATTVVGVAYVDSRGAGHFAHGRRVVVRELDGALVAAVDTLAIVHAVGWLDDRFVVQAYNPTPGYELLDLLIVDPEAQEFERHDLGFQVLYVGD